MPESPSSGGARKAGAEVIAGAIATPLLEARGLCYAAGEKRLVDNIDLRLMQGRRTLVMGANGSGKSLLLRLLHGLIPPSAGRVFWQGRPLDRAARNRQSMVFQRPVMLRRSVLANLRFALAVRGFHKSEQSDRVAEALRRARLEELAKRPARVLSGGEQQRLAVARALAVSPTLLFLDEPTASLDPASTQAIEELILAADAAGVTVVMVSHDQGQARRLAEEIVFLHDGRVAESGPAEQVLDRPRSGAAQAWLDGRLYLAET